MRLPLVIFVLCTVLCLTTFLVRSAKSAANVSDVPSIEEYENIPQGVLLPNIYTLLKRKNMSFSENSSFGTTDAMTLEDIIEAYHKGNYEIAAKYLLPLSESGSHQVEEILGIMYLNGQGVPKDPKDAYYWFSKAAEAGRPLAEHYLGVLTFAGIGVPPPRTGVQADPVKALMWLNIAILHYPTGPEKEQAIKDHANIAASLKRRDRDRAFELTKSWLYSKGERLLFDLEMNQ